MKTLTGTEQQIISDIFTMIDKGAPETKPWMTKTNQEDVFISENISALHIVGLIQTLISNDELHEHYKGLKFFVQNDKIITIFHIK